MKNLILVLVLFLFTASMCHRPPINKSLGKRKRTSKGYVYKGQIPGIEAQEAKPSKRNGDWF